MSALKGHPKGLYLIFATSTAERYACDLYSFPDAGIIV